MATKKQDLSKLSLADLDELIIYGLQQQESVPRHGDEYKHYLNVVASAKQAKAKRIEDGDTDHVTASGDLNFKDISDTIDDTMHLAPDGDPKDAEIIAATDAPIAPEPVSPSADIIPADQINQGIPGVEAGSANDAPENKNQA